MESIPAEYWGCTPVTYAATAGMRLLSPQDQEVVYDALYEGLTSAIIALSTQSSRIHWPFRQLKRSDIFTLDGKEEGLYGMMAANYLSGNVHANLYVKEEEDVILAQMCSNDGEEQESSQTCAAVYSTQEMGEEQETQQQQPQFLGALDMGGSSTQIVFHPGTTDTVQAIFASDSIQLNHSEFFSTSYLSYGVDKFRERLWEVLIQEHKEEENDSRNIPNPCMFPGYTTVHERYTFYGTGNATDCTSHIRRLLPNLDLSHEITMEDEWAISQQQQRVVGGIAHPPVRGKFYAMSLYYFTLDCLRELSYHQPHHGELKEQLRKEWPSPRLDQLRHAVEGFCARSWTGVSYSVALF